LCYNAVVHGLHDITRLSDATTRSISAENPTGARRGGAQASPGDDASCTDAARTLGRGWKVRPCRRHVAAGETFTVADIEGPGVVRHMWFTVDPARLADLSLSVTYDEAAMPAIVAPLGAFFANGIDGLAVVQSVPIAVNPRGGLNCYWPAPFRRRVRIDVTNDGADPIAELFYQVTWSREGVPDDAAYLHAEARRAVTDPDRPEHVLLETVTGRGHYVGTYIAWEQRSAGWWGEGEVKFFIDDDPADAPTICGTGTEDYFGGAWGFAGDDATPPQAYTGPFLGYPQAALPRPGAAEPLPARHGLYRWHLPDPIRFGRSLRVTVQALGWWPDDTYQPLADELSSVALWYQDDG
jgi:hypothetical protein